MREHREDLVDVEGDGLRGAVVHEDPRIQRGEGARRALFSSRFVLCG